MVGLERQQDGTGSYYDSVHRQLSETQHAFLPNANLFCLLFCYDESLA